MVVTGVVEFYFLGYSSNKSINSNLYFLLRPHLGIISYMIILQMLLGDLVDQLQALSVPQVAALALAITCSLLTQAQLPWQIRILLLLRQRTAVLALWGYVWCIVPTTLTSAGCQLLSSHHII